ncbi:hypothetical protein [Streptomyces sp. NBC_01198]|uniref:hypothetical protein n=1 Tax=Streptomyces sp. NBC_01198 TaxID=2903769 RepID=UPI002E106A78|nr:hypothetical protein OG702_08720 [Streptomyces sp. NBC_01198]
MIRSAADLDTPNSSASSRSLMVLVLAEAFGITTFLAAGRKAQGALARAGIAATPVRHPAQGGARAFTEQLAVFNASSCDGR